MALGNGQGFVDRGVGTLSCSRRNVPVSGRSSRRMNKNHRGDGNPSVPMYWTGFPSGLIAGSSPDPHKTKRRSDHLLQATGYKAWKAMRASYRRHDHSVHNGMRIGRSILKEWDTPLPKSKRCLLSRCES